MLNTKHFVLFGALGTCYAVNRYCRTFNAADIRTFADSNTYNIIYQNICDNIRISVIPEKKYMRIDGNTYQLCI